MARTFDRPILLQRINEATEEFSDLYSLHASINKTRSDNEYVNAGAIRDKRTLTFEVRYFEELEDIANNTQSYRIVYQGVPYNVVDYDDYMLRHKTVKLVGESY